MVDKYDFKKIEKKWQKRWERKKAFEPKKKGKKFYCLDMFPYPSGEGLHMGHAFVYTLGDIFARFKRLENKNVLYPIGYDSLGLPAENAAIKVGMHPEDYTNKAIKNFMKQQKAMGWSYHWGRKIKTSDPDYYKWDQWIFLKMLEKGLAYKRESAVNYCKKCQTVLANEQVKEGRCWRCGSEVEVKHLEQWFLKIRDYADELLKGLEKLDWPDKAKKMQRNWIGKSKGAEINFKVNDEEWLIFTTRPDTIFGVTFMVISAQHPRLMELVKNKQKKEVEKFLKKINTVSEKNKKEEMNKEGVFTGSYAINPVNNEKVPIWVGNFVVADYGSGMVMAVPAHDFRDYEFAKKYNLKIREVVKGGDIKEEAYTGEGELVNSGDFNGLSSEEGKEKITDFLIKKKKGRRKTEYKLKNWLISRQRYWGTPIPVVYCKKCGIVPVPEKNLPVELPKNAEFGKGNPLETNKEWIKTKCSNCGGEARRETDTMDTFVNSSWYYLRYTDPDNKIRIFDKKKANYWCPIDQYIGGPEHITMHLIYIRFYTKFLRDLGLLKFDEPALRYFTQGIVHGEDGDKMSKSKGNIIEPLETIEKYGADTLRLALVSFGSPDTDSSWDESIVEGSKKFLEKVYKYFYSFKKGRDEKIVQSKINSLALDVREDVENFKHNLAVIKIREFFNYISDKKISKRTGKKFLKILNPYCPHITGELWKRLGGRGFISKSKWPKINKDLEEKEKEAEKLLDDIRNILDILRDKNQMKGKKKIRVFPIPKEVGLYKKREEKIQKTFGLEVEVESVRKAGKKIKAKPGKPGILIE
jgi:leucyl-tRNA synthetase